MIICRGDRIKENTTKKEKDEIVKSKVNNARAVLGINKIDHFSYMREREYSNDTEKNYGK